MYIYRQIYIYIYIDIYVSIHGTQSTQISGKQDEHNIYVIMKTMCPPGTSNRASCAQVHELPQNHCGENPGAHCLYIYIYIYI